MIPGWLDEMEADVVACLEGRDHVSVDEMAEALGMSEESAVRYITLLASAGRLRIDAVSLPPPEPWADLEVSSPAA